MPDRTRFRVVGLTTDLGVVGSNYNTALALYFVGYVLFEVPSNVSDVSVPRI